MSKGLTTAETTNNLGSLANIEVELYQQLTGTSPTDQTDAIDTTGASGSYSEASVTTVTSTIDPTITNLGYARCHDTGHAATSKLIPTLLFPGFGQNGMTQFSDALTRRMAGYVDLPTGRAPLVIKLRTRGRGGSGTIDYARDTYDVADILDHAVNAVGSDVYGYGTAGGASAICIGYSTGGLDALNFAARFPDRCLGVVLYFPNYDNGADPADSYYMLAENQRASIAASIQPDGDVRLNPGAASVDQYMARNPIDAIARIMAIPDGPDVWLITDLNEVGDGANLPSPTRLQNALQSIPAAKGKAHIHVTQTGDSNRVLHDNGANSTEAIYAERYFFPYLLKNVSEWTMPRISPPGDLRILGWMKTKLFEIWLGPNTKPKTAASEGGRDHAAEFHYDEYTRRFKISPITSTDGYVQVIHDGDNCNRSEAFTAATTKYVDLNIIQSISDVTDIGIEHSFRGDVGVTDSSGVTNWADQVGALAFTALTNKPSTATDSDGKALIRFSDASSQKLLLNSLLVDPTQDFTIFCVVNKTNSTLGTFWEISNHGTLARTGLLYTPSTDSAYAQNDTNGTMLDNINGAGGHTFTQNAKHVLAVMRKDNILYESIDGGSWSRTGYISGSYTITGTNTTSLGAGWANSGGAYWHFLTGDIYEIDSKQCATSEVDVFAYNALMKTRWDF